MYVLFYRLHVADVAVAANPAFISVYSVVLSSKDSDFLHYFFFLTINMWESPVEK